MKEIKNSSRLLDMIDAGKINEAENRLYDLIIATDMGSLETALLFDRIVSGKCDKSLRN